MIFIPSASVPSLVYIKVTAQLTAIAAFQATLLGLVFVPLLRRALYVGVPSSGVNDVTYLYIRDKPLRVPDWVYGAYFALSHAVGSAALIGRCCKDVL